MGAKIKYFHLISMEFPYFSPMNDDAATLDENLFRSQGAALLSTARFPPVPPSHRLIYEPLDKHNLFAVGEMFRGDDSPFVQGEYRDSRELEAYLEAHLRFTRCSITKGGCDWLFRHAENGQYVGLFNVYDLNRESPVRGDYPRKCTIGFATRAEYRRQGFTAEAIENFLAYIFRHFEVAYVLAYTLKENKASAALLRKMNFSPNQADYLFHDRYNYFERFRSHMLKA
jgi:RimJ/RimL family protein N-acetyltransferase